MRKRAFLSVVDLTPDELREVLSQAQSFKALRRKGERTSHILASRSFALVFEKPSLRTRMSFEVGLRELGAQSVTYLAPQDIQLGKREPVQDVARNLERWVDGVIARVFDHRVLEEMREATHHLGVINALSDREHPCQALADFQTIYEIAGSFQVHLVFIGDGNNVAHSLALMAASLGADFTLACPEGYEPNPTLWTHAQNIAQKTGGHLTLTHDPIEAVRTAQFIYTDVWASMGQEHEAAARRKAFAKFRVNDQLLTHAPEDVRIMHCLPAHRGEEITENVLESPRSVILDQAENRLHAQKALLAFLFGS